MYNKSKTVIVYLAMNTKKDETYGRDSRSMLEKSLDSLYNYYNNKFKHDIIIFYDKKAPFLEEDQIDIKKNRNEITFRLLDGDLWSPPDCLEIKNNPNIKNWIAPQFSLGYRNMMRWYGILIYKYLTDLGYEWYMRMDDDSLLHSDIEYDIFKYMNDNNYEYGFRSYCNDGLGVSNGLIEFCKKYMDKNDIKPTFLDRYIKDKKSWKSTDYNILGYYNNFLISKLSFWMRDDVQKFLKEFDNSGYMYTRRWNDLISQAVTIQIFMERNKVYHFNDWTYEHTTFSGNYDSKSELEWGGLFPKIEDSQVVKSDYTDEWIKKYNDYHINTFDTINVEDCLTEKDFNVLSDRDESTINIGNYNHIEDIYMAINDHWINYNTNIRVLQFEHPKPYGFIWYNNGDLNVINNEDNIIFNNKDDNIKKSFIASKSIYYTNEIKVIKPINTTNINNKKIFLHYLNKKYM